MTENKPVSLPSVALVQASEVPSLLECIRPSWQAKNLIGRVKKLIEVDPSSACQRLFNAAIHDLREKIVVAGLDIAREAAKQNKLPPVDRPEDVENYSTERLIELAYRVGLLTRPDWRRLSRCYEIRRDLEHEDDEYEAGVEDCIYIFKTCIEVVLSRDPVHLIRVADLRDVVEQPTPAILADSLVADFAAAPQPRQDEIARFLISIALDKDQSEIVQQNAFNAIARLAAHTQNAVKLQLATHFQERIGKKGLDRRHARVAYAAGVLPYLKKADVVQCFEDVYAQMKKVGSHWSGHTEHGELLRSFRELGGVGAVPAESRAKFLKWMVFTYLGEPGGMTSYGNVRHVFYSNTAAPLITTQIREAAHLIGSELKKLKADKDVATLCTNAHIARRFELLLDKVEGPDVA